MASDSNILGPSLLYKWRRDVSCVEDQEALSAKVSEEQAMDINDEIYLEI
jgi:hypothetical protein